MTESELPIPAQVDAAWMRLVGNLFRFEKPLMGKHQEIARAFIDLETIRLQAGLPALEEVAGCRLHSVH